MRGLEVLDGLGRVRIEASAAPDHGHVRVFSLSSWDEPGDRTNWAAIGANEECEGAQVYVGLWSGDEGVAMLEAVEGAYGVPGVPTMELDCYERTGKYSPHGKILTRRTRTSVVGPDGLTTTEERLGVEDDAR